MISQEGLGQKKHACALLERRGDVIPYCNLLCHDCLSLGLSCVGYVQVVTKLFHIVEPDVACFGQKDYQQWRLITRMVSNSLYGVSH